MYEFSMVYYGIQWYIMVYYLKSLKSDEQVDLVQRLGYVVMIFHVSFTTFLLATKNLPVKNTFIDLDIGAGTRLARFPVWNSYPSPSSPKEPVL